MGSKKTQTTVGYGNGGWVRVDRDGLPGPVYMRFAQAAGGRWQVRDLYIEAREGEPIEARHLRDLPLAALEAMVLAHRDRLRPDTHGPDLGTLASNYATTFGRRPASWVAESMRDPAANRRLRRQPPRAVPAPEVPPLDRPDRLDDEFLRHVADAYADAIRRGASSPAAQLAAEAGGGLPVRTVHRWIYLARKAGHLPPGTRGRIG